jgi:hypothetical protein
MNKENNLETNTEETRYRDPDKSLARLPSRCILFDVENISFDASLVIYINSTNIPPIMIINKFLRKLLECFVVVRILALERTTIFFCLMFSLPIKILCLWP